MNIIQIPAKFGNRKIFSFDDENEKIKLTNFKVGSKVLPSETFEQDLSKTEYFFIKKHEPGTKFWMDGGYECSDSTGARRGFFLDSLILHPNSFELRNENVKILMNGDNIKKRGRKGDPEKAAQREEMERIRLEKIEAGIPIRRGRPSIDPSLRKSKPYISNGGKRGRKPLSPDEKIRREQENNKTEEKRQRGRPAIPGLRELKQVDKLKLLEAKLKLGIITGRGRISDEDNQRLKQYLKTL